MGNGFAMAKISASVKSLFSRCSTCSFFYIFLSIFPILFFISGFFFIRHKVIQSYVLERSGAQGTFVVLLDERLKKIRDIGLSLAQRPLLKTNIKAGEWEKACQIFNGIEKVIPEIDRIFITDTAAVIKADMDQHADAIGSSREDADWFIGVKARQAPYISQVYKRRTSSKFNVINIAIPINDDNVLPDASLPSFAPCLGFLVIQIRLESFSDIAVTWGNVPGDIAMILDQGGKIVYVSDQGVYTPGMDVSLRPVVARLLKDSSISGFISAAGLGSEKSYFWTKLIPTAGWRLLVEESKNSFEQQINSRLRLGVLILWIFVAGYLLFIVLFVRYFLVLQAKRDDLQKIFDAAKVGLMLIDDKFVVRQINSTLASWQDIDLPFSKTLRPGEVLGCSNQILNKHRCGEGDQCFFCNIYKLISNTLTQKEALRHHEISKSFIIKGQECVRSLMIDATLLTVNNTTHVLLSLTDISPLKKSQAMLREAKRAAEESLKLQESLVKTLSLEIEERKKIEGNLRIAQKKAIEGEAWWRSLIQEIPAVSFVLEVDGAIRMVNRDWMGMPPQKLKGASFFSFLDTQEQQVFSNALTQAFDQKMSVHFETYSVSVTGEKVWFENYLWPVEIDGRISGCVLLCFDITSVKRSRDLLKEMSLAVEHSPLSIIITDRFGKIKYVNPHFTDVTGFSFEDVFDKMLRVLRPNELSPEQLSSLWKTVKEGHDWQGEFLERCKDGMEFWERITITPVMDDHGKILNLIVLKENIDEQKRVHEKLLESERRFMDVLYSSNDAILLIQGDKFVDCNDATAKMLKYSARQDFLMTHPSQLSPPVQPDGCSSFEKAQEMIKIAYEKGFNRFEWMHRKADGMDFPVEVSLTPIVYDGKDLLYCVWRDITEHKQAQEELMRNQAEMVNMLEELKLYNVQLEDAQQRLVQQEKLVAIGFLAAGVAHEINNPLGFIHGNLASLEEYAKVLLKMASFLNDLGAAIAAKDIQRAEEINARIEEEKDLLELDFIKNDFKNLIAETQDGLERIKKIVQGLKNFSRKDTEGLVFSNIHEVLEDAINIVFNEIKYKADLVKDYSDIPQLDCNPQQIGQVFINLLMNAVQAIPEHGTITVKTFISEGMAVIAVSDTGTGIPDDVKDKIFDPFFTTKDPGKGTGLGLSISYDIIKKHGGRIELESALGQGTTFSVYLPLKTKDNVNSDGVSI